MDNENNDLVKQTSKIALNAALSPIKKSILLSLLSILPYLIGAILIVILFCGIYMSIDEQADAVTNLGQKVGNAVQLYGFKTEAEVEQQEEDRFYNTLGFYKGVYDLNRYDILLISNTLLFEGMYEDKLEFVEDSSDGIEITIPSKDGNVLVEFFDMINFIYKSFYSGFSSAFMSSSQYKKANKILSEPVIVIKKCHSLTSNMKDFKQCYRGYLVAEYDDFLDQLIESDKIETEVKPGYLILDDIFNLKDLNIDLNDEIEDGLFNLNNFIFKFNPVAWLLNAIHIHLGVEFKRFNDQLRTAITILIFGKLAGPPLDRIWWNNKHFFYNGYIVKYLKEYYKVSKGEYSDGNINDIYIDRKNKLEIANLIIETTDAYMDMDENTKNNNPSKGDSGYATGSSCKPISSKDLESFSSPTNGVSCSVNSCFGVYAGKWACTAHKGVDVNASSGIYSVCDGVVTFAGMYNNGSASAIETDCNINGKVYHVRYLHMPLDDVYRFKVGDAISSGQRLGNQGAVGNGVTGAHLHLDVSLNGVYVNPESIVSGCSFSYDCEGTRNSCQSTGQYFCK